MPDPLNVVARIQTLALLVLMSACTPETSQKPAAVPTPAEVEHQASEASPSPQGSLSERVSIKPPPTMAPARPPEPRTLREGAPMLLAEYRSGVLIPFARNASGTWMLERVRTLDDMPEGFRGKDAHPEVIETWWKSMDIQEGDVFQLQGDRGATGHYTVRLEFATADRGVCMGLVWALQGTATWATPPKGEEHVWATRVRWSTPSVALKRDLNPREIQMAEAILKLGREAAHAMVGPELRDSRWYECDGLGPERCSGKYFRTIALDLEGDGSPEVMTASQLRERGSDDPMVIEQRFLISFQGERAYLLGKWSDPPRRRSEATQPYFAGALDITGDGRAEIVMSRTANETQNWEFFEADPTHPGTWKALLKTKFEGC